MADEFTEAHCVVLVQMIPGDSASETLVEVPMGKVDRLIAEAKSVGLSARVAPLHGYSEMMQMLEQRAEAAR